MSRKGNTYAKKDWSINDTSSLLKNTHYKKFHTKKKRIQLKYDKRLFEWHTSRPPASIKKWFLEEGQYQWREYLKEITDLLFTNDGDFQEFLWDILSEQNKEIMERKARGSYYK